MALSGTLGVASGPFNPTTTSVAGTGKLAGATGALSFSGGEDPAGGGFTEDTSGAICVDLAP